MLKSLFQWPYLPLKYGFCVQVSGTARCDNSLYDTTHAGPDIASRSCLISLSATNTAKVNTRASYPTSIFGETSFRGYLYTPIQNMQVRVR